MPKKTTKAATKSLATLSAIRISGARTHNLKSIEVEIPHDQITVITGPSGCGKSSLAIDTLFAEGQRQFLETLSVYTRQYLDQLPTADVDSIEGLLPTLKIDQHANSVGPRSTVGTITEIHDYLRVLFARVGTVHCLKCGEPIGQQTPAEMQGWICRLPEGTKLMVLAPIVRDRKGLHRETFEQIRNERLVRVRVDGNVFDIDDVPELDSRQAHTVEAITDRIVVREGVENRLLEAIDLALRLTGRLVGISYQRRSETESPNEQWKEKLFSSEFACATCEISYPEIEPRTFSFNSPHGACPECQGLGQREQFSPDLLIPNRKLTLSSPAIVAWKLLPKKQREKALESLDPLLQKLKFGANQALAELSPAQWNKLWVGESEKVPGLSLVVEKNWATAVDARLFEALDAARIISRCSACNGGRLGPTAQAIHIAGNSIIDVSELTIDALNRFFKDTKWTGHEAAIAQTLVTEILHRAQYLNQVGLSYLTLNRSGQSLSGGELQRVRLAAAIGSGQTNVCYILDEPSIGLHSRDNEKLIVALQQLRESGNTVVVVEHDEAIMRTADKLIDLGPGAGLHGGTVVSVGTPNEVVHDSASITGRYLSGKQQIAIPRQRRKGTKFLSIKGAGGNNLKNVTADFPVGCLTCVTGVSGSGKSTLINRTLVPALFNHFNPSQRQSDPFESLVGIEHFEKLVEVDQRPIGRNARSCPATYTGIFDEIRKVFAETRDARRLGFDARQFSFNSGPGRCSECNGLGEKKLEMKFLPDVRIVCPVCHGGRYQIQTLAVRYRERSIADVLRLPIETAAIEFADFPKIFPVLQTLTDVGLGYLTLGQSAPTLSGGEAQRIKLASELATRSTGRTLYILDEPTTGLHFDDVNRLIQLLSRLVEMGNSVIVIEHHLDMIKSADWVIDLGPEGGHAGGEIVAAGTPEAVAANPNSHTGKCLLPLLQ